MFDWFKRKKPKPDETRPPEDQQTPAPLEEATEPSAAPLLEDREGGAEPGPDMPPPAVAADVTLPQEAGEGVADVPETDRPEVTPEQAGFVAEPEQVEAELPAPLTGPPSVPEPEETQEPEAVSEPEKIPVAAAPPVEKKSWFARLKEGLSKSTSRITEGIGGIFTKRKLDEEQIEALEELLIQADLGPTLAAKLAAGLAKTRFGKEVSAQEVREYLAGEVTRIVEPVAQPLTIDPARKPHVILVVGVNGTGKTTTIGKIANQLRAEGKTVWLAAGDTFRAAAVSQLKIWGERTGCPVIAKDTGADAAGLAYEALEKARAAGADVLLIDTAGRLQNKAGLMEELRKIVRVLKKLEPDAPHTTLLTLDATTGQNAHSQVEVFKDMVSINGLILTKLDGSARGGVLVALASKFGIPVHAIGVGEGVYDLRPFEAKAFARALVGLE